MATVVNLFVWRVDGALDLSAGPVKATEVREAMAEGGKARVGVGVLID